MRLRLLSLLAPAFLMALTLAAQTPTTGLLTGTVKDPSGATVPNAKLTLLSPSGEERTGTTAADGSYRFPLLAPGSYTLSIDAPGFQTYQATGIAIRITEATELSPSLAIAGAAVSVDVTSEVPLVQTASATTGRVIGEQQIRELPLPTRNFQQILTLSPGTVASLSNNTEMGRGDVNISVAGNRSTSNNVVVDGTQINSPGTNSTPNISVPAPDAIQEFIVQTSLYDATQGRNAGGNVAVVTKSGENVVHGSGWEFFRNRELNANDFFLNAAGRPRPVLNRNQFGGTLGGPIVKDKTFFFASYQGTRERNGASLTNSLSFPNIPAGLTNDRSLAALNALNVSLYAPGATVPALSPISAKLLQAKLPDGSWAIPSAAGAAASPAIPVVTPLSGVSTLREDQFNINIDQSIGQNNRLSGKVFYSDTPQYQSLFSFVGSNPFQIPGYGGDIDFHNRVVSLNDSHIITPSLINQAHFGYSRINGPSSPQEPLKNSDVGINNPLCATNPSFCGLATIQVLGLFSIGSTTLADQKSTVQSFEWTDMLTWTHGKHLVRFGGEARRYRVDFFFNFFSRGQINFNSFKDFLDGNIAFGLLGNGVHDRGMRATDGAAFIQDDYKVSDSLTLNFGLRFQRQGGISEIRGRLANFDPSVLPAYNPACTVTAPCTTGTGFTILKPGEPLNPSTNDFAPRFGFAWKPPAAKNLVVRGGYGVYFDRFSTRVANLQIFNYPFDIVGLGLGSFANPFPNLANVTFPINPPTVPSPVPFYYAGVPLATTPTAISGIYVSHNFRTPYVQQYSLGVQWEVFRDWMAEVGYVGAKGTKLVNVYTLNQGTSPLTAPYGAAVFSTNKALNGFQLATTDADSIYNSLQSSLTKRFSKGLQFLASYTYSKSIDDASGAPTNEFAAVPGNQQNRASNRSVSDFDRPNRFVLSGTYSLPKFYGGKSSVAARLANDWQLGGIVTLQSGAPYSVICVSGSALYNRADLLPNQAASLSGSAQSLTHYFNTSAFAPTCTNTAPFGNSGRNILRGPDQRNVDLSAVKFIPVKEAVKMEFRTEFFNTFNRVTFALPNNNVLVPATLGTITSTAAGPRVIQFALKVSF
jgi:Carboxypeptidase regulatory-like domain/TonB-dependent Receptor Plug Domain